MIRRFGELLVERGFISGEQLREALRIQSHEKKRLGQILIEMGALSADELNWALSELLGIPYVDLTEEMVDLEVARAMPEEVLRRHRAVPVLRVGNELTVVLADPTDRQAILELEALGGASVRTAMASADTVAKLLDKAFPRSVGGRDRTRYSEIGEVTATSGGDATGVAQVHALLGGALRARATDIHLEPLLQEIRVRYRVDGGLVEQPRLPRSALGPILARCRVLAGLHGEALPAEAHLRTRLEGQELEVDVLLYPTLYGEAVTVSLWRRGHETPTLDALALPADARTAVDRLLAAEPGLVMVTGWEPRARTALLYAMARAVATPSRKVLTLERAVSYLVPDFVQVEVPGDFGTSVTTILDQPADVVMVEDIEPGPAILAAFASAERGALVLAGIRFATNAAGLAHLLAVDVPRGPLLAATRGLVHVRRRGLEYHAEVLPMTEALRRELGPRPDGHR